MFDINYCDFNSTCMPCPSLREINLKSELLSVLVYLFETHDSCLFTDLLLLLAGLVGGAAVGGRGFERGRGMRGRGAAAAGRLAV